MVWRTRPCTGSWLSRPPARKQTPTLCWTACPSGEDLVFLREWFRQDRSGLSSRDCVLPHFHPVAPAVPAHTVHARPLASPQQQVGKQCSLLDHMCSPASWQHLCTHTEQWSGPSPFLLGGPGGASEARRGSAGGQRALSFE